MDYINKLISKWMAEGSRVAVDSHPRLSGIMDTVNSTLAHPKETRLPGEFYDAKSRALIEKIEVEEWFSGYQENQEYRALGIGALMGDVVSRMVGHVEGNGNDGLLEIGGDDKNLGVGRGGEQGIKFAMSGCHDTTLAAILASLGTFEPGKMKWPPYTSHIAMELFRKNDVYERISDVSGKTPTISRKGSGKSEAQKPSLWSSLMGSIMGTSINGNGNSTVGTGRKTMSECSDEEKAKLQGYFVRLRYNDEPVVVPGCRVPGNHLPGDESFCTLVRFS